MRDIKRKRLEEQGWQIGNAGDFLGLSAQESAYVDLRLKLSNSLKQHRQRQNLTQIELARLMESSQSRIAKMEAADSSISLDSLIRSLLALGVSNQDLANIISPSQQSRLT